MSQIHCQEIWTLTLHQVIVLELLTNNTDPDKYGYSGYGIEFDTRSQFSIPDGEWGRNVIFGKGY